MSSKKKILLLSDDLRLTSGVGTVSKEFVLGTLDKYDWAQIGGAINHPDQGKVFDMKESVKKEFGIDGYLKIYPVAGYGNPNLLREVMKLENPDAIIIYTDPRFWGWFFQMEAEIRQTIPILYYNIWDDLPYPMWNEPYYESVDVLMNISKQTYNIVKNVRQFTPVKDWECTYIPHGINEETYQKIGPLHKEYDKLKEFRESMFKNVDIDFTIFYNNRNIKRKMTSDLILAFKIFCDKLPKTKADKCVLLLHTQPKDPNGTDLAEVALHLCPDYKVYFSHKKLDTKHLNYLYNIADVTVNIASNEGFGLGTAESLMAGTPIIVNVTGGMQDQCGFKKEDGTYLTEKDYTTDWGSNHNGRYKDHGEWVKPVWPKTRSIQGSMPTPYIFDDRVDFEDVANVIEEWYKVGKDERERCGESGREFLTTPGLGLSAKEMCKLFVNSIDTCLKEWKPKKRYTLYDVTKFKCKLPKNSGVLLKEL